MKRHRSIPNQHVNVAEQAAGTTGTATSTDRAFQEAKDFLKARQQVRRNRSQWEEVKNADRISRSAAKHAGSTEGASNQSNQPLPITGTRVCSIHAILESIGPAWEEAKSSRCFPSSPGVTREKLHFAYGPLVSFDRKAEEVLLNKASYRCENTSPDEYNKRNEELVFSSILHSKDYNLADENGGCGVKVKVEHVRAAIVASMPEQRLQSLQGLEGRQIAVLTMLAFATRPAGGEWNFPIQKDVIKLLLRVAGQTYVHSQDLDDILRRLTELNLIELDADGYFSLVVKEDILSAHGSHRDNNNKTAYRKLLMMQHRHVMVFDFLKRTCEHSHKKGMPDDVSMDESVTVTTTAGESDAYDSDHIMHHCDD